ncbi:MAG TPA: NAD-dependent epimerase/dehydratase family protein [Bryobacteraceae bacterium]|jgi:CDP-glucose 4,6-dehydratase
MFDNYFSGKRCLVTGASGVKATWLALMLLRAGAIVTGLDKKPAALRSNFTASGLAGRIRFIHGDVRDLPCVRGLIAENDCVFHLAAEAIVGRAMRTPLETYSSNTLGTATVLEALRLADSPKRAVFVTSDKVYAAKPQSELWVESDQLGATGPYAVSKACAEFVIGDYNRIYFANSETRIAVARAGNVLIGGDDHSSSTTDGAGRIFVDCYEALADGREPEVFRPTFTRPYTYGLDILSGYMSLMTKLNREGIAGEAFNFGPYEQFGVSNALLATKICELWGAGILWKAGAPRDEPFEYQSLWTEKSRKRLEWRPAFTLYEALEATTRWYKAWAALGANVTEGCMYNLNASMVEEHRAAAARLGLDWAREIQSDSAGHQL